MAGKLKSPLLASLLSAFVWPGAGQLFNKDFKKGAVLIALTFMLCLSFMIGAEREIKERLPQDMSTLDMAKARVIMDELLQENSDYVVTFNLLMLAAWAYSILDAYLTAREAQAPPPETPPDGF